MNKRRIMASALAISLLFNTSVFAAEGIQTYNNVNVEVNNKDYQNVKFSDLITNENYSKIKVNNLKTNETEYVEQKLQRDKNGKVTKKIIVTKENGDKIFIENKDNTIILRKNNVILKQIPIEIEENTGIRVKRSYGSWGSPLITKTHTAVPIGAGVGTVVGILAGIVCPGSLIGSSILGSVAGTIISNQIPDVWILMRTWTRVDTDRECYESKRIVDFYKYSNYTGFIKTVGPETWEYCYGGL